MIHLSCTLWLQVEMELVLDTRSPNYERSKGEQIAINVDGTGDQAAANYYTGDRMDKQVLTSVKGGLSDGRFVGLYSVHPDWAWTGQGLGTSTMSDTSHCNLNKTGITHRDYCKFPLKFTR